MFIINAYRFLKKLCYTIFDGVNEYVTVPHSASLNFERTDEFTIAMWVYIDATQTKSIIAKTAPATSYRGYDLILVNGQLQFTLYNNNSTSNRVSNRVTSVTSVGVWHCVIVDKTTGFTNADLNITVDDILQTTSIITGTLTGTIVNSNPLYFGRRIDGIFFDGNIDKVVIYNKKLTAGEKTQFYNYGRKAGDVGISGVISQWEMDSLNPPDVVGSNGGTSVNMDSSNIVCE